jgi:hypothetical protein
MKKKTSTEKESGSTREEKTCVTESIVTKVETFQFIDRSKIFLLLSFLIPIGLRAVPEILMGHFVVGFDPLGYYIPYTLTWLREGVSLWPFLGAAPLLYLLMIGITWIGVPIVFSLKVMSPLLLGFLGLAIFFYANKTLLWSSKKSLLAALFATLYFVALRISWDMLRIELALIFLFISMILLEKNDKRPFLKGAMLSIVMSLVVFAHQIIGAILIAIIIVTIIRSYLGKQTSQLRKIVISSVPVVFLFCTIVIVDTMLPEYFATTAFSQNSEITNALFSYTSSLDLLLNTAGFFAFCYLPLMPLILFAYKGIKTSIQLKTWIFFIFTGLFIIFASGSIFFSILPYRLILLLTYPFSFYATEAFCSFESNRKKVCVGLMLATFSLSFMVLPFNSPFIYFSLFPTYAPNSMLMNTVPKSDCQDTINALQWTRNNLPSNSRLIVHTAFYGWASLTLDNSKIVSCGFDNIETVAQELSKNDSSHHYYSIWWINCTGWFGQPDFSSVFTTVYASGRIAILNFTLASITGLNSQEKCLS